MAATSEVWDRHNVVAPRPRILHVGLGCPQASDPHLDDVVADLELRDVPDRVSVSPLDAVDKGEVVQVRIEMHNVESLIEGSHDGVCDGVVTPDYHGERAGSEYLLHVAGDVVEGPLDVGIDDVGVPTIDDPVLTHLILQVAPIILDVVVSRLLLRRAEASVTD